MYYLFPKGCAPRLISTGPYQWAGVVQVRHRGEWWAVCDDRWDRNDASVVCQGLGYGGGVLYTGLGGMIASQYLLDDLQCKGDEKSLCVCPLDTAGLGNHNCRHNSQGITTEGATVACGCKYSNFC